MSERAKLRVGMIGTGYISYQHGPAWLGSADAELVALCDADKGRAEARAREWGVGRVYTDAAEMLRAEHLDAVDIVTRPETHTALVGLASGAGKAVLCQKPLAPTLDEASIMVATCERAGVPFMVTEMWRYLPWFREMKRQLEAGAIGAPHYLRIVGSRNAMRRERPVNDTQPYFADMPKLIVYEMMIHWIDAARSLLGEVDSVYARMAQLNPAIVGEDFALVVLTHGDATTAMDGSWGTPVEPPGGTREGDIVLEGVEGQLHFAPRGGELRLTTRAASEVVATFPDIAAGFQSAFNGCIRHFASAVRHGTPFESSAADNLKTLGATLAAYESAHTGQVVRV